MAKKKVEKRPARESMNVFDPENLRDFLELLSFVFPKGELANISEAGKNAINKAIARIEAALKKRFGI